MTPRCAVPVFRSSLLALALVTAAQGQGPDGLYATLHTTMGDIRFRLEHERAPRTVANFVSLAEGTRPWLNVEQGRPSAQPFYSGLTFHRVASNFVIQTGAPRGIGSRGPGYRFRDEFSTNLRHSVAGTVSMANNGPNSNGSQFFITLRPLPALDFDQAPLTSAHAVFGYVVDGLSVVSNIGSVATSPPGDGRPLVDVVTTNVTVERIGTSAQAFDPLAVVPVLPVVRATTCEPGRDASGNFFVAWPADADLYWPLGAVDLTRPLPWAQVTSSSIPNSGMYVSGLVTNVSPFFMTVVAVESFE